MSQLSVLTAGLSALFKTLPLAARPTLEEKEVGAARGNRLSAFRRSDGLFVGSAVIAQHALCTGLETQGRPDRTKGAEYTKKTGGEWPPVFRHELTDALNDGREA